MNNRFVYKLSGVYLGFWSMIIFNEVWNIKCLGIFYIFFGWDI